GPPGDELVVALATQRPAVHGRVEGASQEALVVGHGDLGPLGRRGQPALFRFGENAAGGHDLVEEGRHLRGRLELELLPQANLGQGRPGALLGQEAGDRLEPAGQRGQALLERGKVPGKQSEERVADSIHGGRASLPEPLLLEVEQLQAEVVDLDVALEADLGRQSRRVERLDRTTVGSRLGDLVLYGFTGPVRQALIFGVEPQECGGVGVGQDRTSEVRLHQVVEVLVERPWFGRRFGPAQLERGEVQCRTPTGSTGRPAISWRTSLVARRIVAMSAAVTSWWVAARTVPWGYSTISTPRVLRPSRNAARSPRTLKSTKFVRTLPGSRRPGAGWAMPPADSIPSSSARPSANRRALA